MQAAGERERIDCCGKIAQVAGVPPTHPDDGLLGNERRFVAKEFLVTACCPVCIAFHLSFVMSHSRRPLAAGSAETIELATEVAGL